MYLFICIFIHLFAALVSRNFRSLCWQGYFLLSMQKYSSYLKKNKRVHIWPKYKGLAYPEFHVSTWKKFHALLRVLQNKESHKSKQIYYWAYPRAGYSKIVGGGHLYLSQLVSNDIFSFWFSGEAILNRAFNQLVTGFSSDTEGTKTDFSRRLELVQDKVCSQSWSCNIENFFFSDCSSKQSISLQRDSFLQELTMMLPQSFSLSYPQSPVVCLPTVFLLYSNLCIQGHQSFQNNVSST